jgi:DNA-binding LacI/PurR family transcriptional regulator
MPVGLKDVAKLAGGSVRTVSNVVNGYPYVTEATRSRVQRALDELAYRPNLAARSLRTGRSEILALAVPAIDAPYFGELARLIVKAAERTPIRSSSSRPTACRSARRACSPTAAPTSSMA